ncbi:tetratricopeptide repeat protein [Candidatus Thiodictyon syntrophicum]|uniref:Tetratricopeptide repeat protein n=1 Tax=Candidatus Thiodictyon syntrophicum TaxID=1166950 RepID=A0A2K8U1T9_9GAMM|nr:hypothetical protein [Candidatus Thiodictyon syntrophicum]AUB79543.1 hypothetical protein THSYN_00245 [Candidatus Thiodictyon syntrophicum]
MIRSAEVAEDQVHPLYLGLAADIFCLANKRGQRLTAAAFAVAPEHTDHRAAMVERLLRYCPEAVAHAVKALAAARGFDEALFYALGERLHFRHERPDFETLTRFSFCWTSPERDRYRIHDLLRRLLAEEDPAQMQQAHAALEAIYRERAETEPVAIAEVIYHANRQNWERGYNEWTAIMRESVNGACYGVAQALTDIRVALTLKTDLSAANVAWLTGESAGFLQDNRLAEQTLRDAIMHCDDALQSDSNLLDALDLKGSAQFRLGDLRVRLDDKARADVDYREAIFSFDKALEIDPTFAPARAHKGIGLAGLAASISNSDPDAAVQFFNASIAEFETALKLTPRDARFHYNRGNVLRFLGDHLMAHGDDGGAISAYQSAVHGFDNTLKVDPNHVFANPTKAGALVGLGMIFSKTGHNSDAKIAFLEAVAACDETLKIAPEYVVAHNNKGSALNKLGALYVSLGDLPAAKSAYEKSIEALDAALRRTSSDALVLSNKGKTLHQLGALLLNQEAMALGCAVLSESEVILTQASSLAPTDESLIVELRLVQDLITQRCISHG